MAYRLNYLYVKSTPHHQRQHTHQVYRFVNLIGLSKWYSIQTNHIHSNINYARYPVCSYYYGDFICKPCTGIDSYLGCYAGGQADLLSTPICIESGQYEGHCVECCPSGVNCVTPSGFSSVCPSGYLCSSEGKCVVQSAPTRLPTKPTGPTLKPTTSSPTSVPTSQPTTYCFKQRMYGIGNYYLYHYNYHYYY